jgi:hypothetical protein
MTVLVMGEALMDIAVRGDVKKSDVVKLSDEDARWLELSPEWLADAASFSSQAAAVTVARGGADLPWAHELDARARHHSAG